MGGGLGRGGMLAGRAAGCGAELAEREIVLLYLYKAKCAIISEPHVEYSRGNYRILLEKNEQVV